MLRRIITYIIMVMSAIPAFSLSDSHQVRHDSISYAAEAVATLSGGANTPFWFISNRQGLGSNLPNSGYVRAAVGGKSQFSRFFSVAYGVDAAAAWRFSSDFVLQQLYADIRFRNVALSIGSKERIPIFNDAWLSSGDLVFSGNGRPIPQIRIEMPDYVAIPGTNNFLSIKGYISYGMFTDDGWQRSFANPHGRQTRHALLHAKGGWMKIGNKERFPLVFEAGLEMAAQWGGQSISNGEVIYFPHGFKDALTVLLAKGGGSNVPIGEQTNVYGNHLGEWAFSLSWNAPSWSLRTYLEHYFEDHSQMLFQYPWRDMLLGVEITLPSNPFVSKFVYEYLCTRDQTGGIYWDHNNAIHDHVPGTDNYYNHSYYTGWQHWGMGLGNPLIISPIYNDDGSIYFKCNRIKGHHFGISGSPTNELTYRVLASVTRGWGTYSAPFEEVKYNCNLLAELTYRPRFAKGFSVSIGAAADFGSILGASRGMMLTIRKTGIILNKTHQSRK